MKVWKMFSRIFGYISLGRRVCCVISNEPKKKSGHFIWLVGWIGQDRRYCFFYDWFYLFFWVKNNIYLVSWSVIWMEETKNWMYRQCFVFSFSGNITIDVQQKKNERKKSYMRCVVWDRLNLFIHSFIHWI